jgi:hypothetical protein
MSQRNEEPFASDLATVYGVVSARLTGSTDDATLLIQRRLEDAVRTGFSLSSAWANLFTVAVVALTDELELRASGEEVSPAVLLAEAAMKHAMGCP